MRGQGGTYSIEAALAVDVLQHSFIQTKLKAGLVKHLPLIRVPCDEPIDLHCFALANPVAACLCLGNETL